MEDGGDGAGMAMSWRKQSLHPNLYAPCLENGILNLE